MSSTSRKLKTLARRFRELDWAMERVKMSIMNEEVDCSDELTRLVNFRGSGIYECNGWS
jgi:hypothetical protein